MEERQRDHGDETVQDVEEDEELPEEVRDHTTSSSAPVKGDGVVLGDGVLVIRQVKQPDADLATAEVSTVSLALAHVSCRRVAASWRLAVLAAAFGHPISDDRSRQLICV